MKRGSSFFLDPAAFGPGLFSSPPRLRDRLWTKQISEHQILLKGTFHKEDTMTLGLAIFTLAHVAISLIGIGAGSMVAYGFLTAKRLDGWTATFLASTVLTSVTGFLFPFHELLASHVVGGISLVILAVAIFARYRRKLAGAWGMTYVIAAMAALYFNVFVLVVQLFEKVPRFRALAPTQSEAPFVVTQSIVLAVFVFLSVLATARLRHEQLQAEINAA